MLGIKNEDDRLDWDKDIVEQWVWKEQIQELLKHGCSVKIIKTVYWKESKKIFDIMEYYKQLLQ